MDELRGPHIQIVLHVKEGLGFGFLKSPFVVSGSLNGYMLETDPVIPCHGPAFDAELVWEADKRRFRSLRVQNVPVKVEVFSMGTQGRKDKVGYLLLSLLGAQPCPSNKAIEVKHTWHRLLGVKAEGKCCQPQLQLSLTIEDRINTPTPRNELKLFHNTEIVRPPLPVETPPIPKAALPSLDEYLAESKKTPKSIELQPNLISDEGLIAIGGGRHLFMLSFVIGTLDNVDMLMPIAQVSSSKPVVDCFVTYSVFTHDITTDKVSVDLSRGENRAQLNQRTWLRIRSSLTDLSLYFSECRLVAKVCVDTYPGMFSIDLRKLIPCDDLNRFLSDFCNTEKALTIQERCFILPSERTLNAGYKRPYIDVEMSLKFVGDNQEAVKPNIPLARSASQLEGCSLRDHETPEAMLTDCRSGSCTNLNQDIGAGYTNITASNTARYKNAAGDAILQTNEIAELIRKMYESFTLNQEKILASRERPLTSDVQIQCDTDKKTLEKIQTGFYVPKLDENLMKGDGEGVKPDTSAINSARSVGRESLKQEAILCDNCAEEKRRRDVNMVLSKMDREELLKKYTEELEDWKEKQQELFKLQLKQKEDYHLELLSKEWERRRCELECKLSKGIGQCRHLAGELSRATEELKLRGFRNTEREKKLLEAKKSLETHYTAKYQDLREASQKMEDDMNHQLKMKDMKIEELDLKLQQAERQIDTLKNNIKNCEKESETRYSGLTKDQTASLIQELRCLEEKLDSAVQSKAFFKEQWGRAVRELHLIKLHTRKQMLTQLKQDRQQLGDIGLETIEDQADEAIANRNEIDIKKLKDDFYVDLLANTPALESHSMISSSGAEALELFENMNTLKNPVHEKLNDLIAQRDKLVEAEDPNEEVLQQLNHDIRSMLLNCGN